MKVVGEYSTCIEQLRLLSIDGNEVVRVNMDKTGFGTIVPENELQNKSKRYYVSEAFSADYGKIYVSKLDLNIEHGKIQTPYNPVLRIGLPVYDDKTKRGLVLINYKAKELFKMIESLNTHEYDEWNIVDLDGYYIYEPTNEKTFGYALEGRMNTGFFSDYPSAWEQMQTSEQGKQVVHDGWIYYKKVSPISNAEDLSADRNWYLIMKVPQIAIDKELQHLVLGLQIGNGVLVPLFLVLGWFLGNFQIKNKQYKGELEEQARVDSLTGLYNRRHVSDLLEYNTELANRQGSDLSLVYVDINDLKFVNDKYGHDTGDSMIKFASEAMQKSVRKTDIVARMGGDEFLIVFPDCSEEQLNDIMKRITESFRADGIRTLNLEWSLSWGSAHWVHNQDTIEDFISRADFEMYNNKKRFKNKD